MGFSLYLKIIRKHSSKFFTAEKSILFLAQEFNILYQPKFEKFCTSFYSILSMIYYTVDYDLLRVWFWFLNATRDINRVKR